MGELQFWLGKPVVIKSDNSAERECFQNPNLFPYLPYLKKPSDDYYYFDPEPNTILLSFITVNNFYCPLLESFAKPSFILNSCLLASSNKILFLLIFTKKTQALKNSSVYKIK